MTLTIALTSVVFLTAAAQAAQKVRFVSSAGVNANDCTRDAPCRTLQRGIDRTPKGGELQILDSDFYGNSVTINKSITISAVGVAASVGSIAIDAPGATVVLRGLLLSGASLPAGNGPSISNASAVYIVDCQIERFPGIGIAIDADNVEVFVANSAVRSNGTHGILLTSFSSGARVTISNSRFENNGESGVRNAGAGGAQMTIENSVFSGNLQGVAARTGSTVRVSNSVAVNNGTGFDNQASTFISRGNNMVSGNADNVSGTITLLPGI
jgi:hypothetical protein